MSDNGISTIVPSDFCIVNNSTSFISEPSLTILSSIYFSPIPGYSGPIGSPVLGYAHLLPFLLPVKNVFANLKSTFFPLPPSFPCVSFVYSRSEYLYSS